jgi:hypothetical protein
MRTGNLFLPLSTGRGFGVFALDQKRQNDKFNPPESRLVHQEKRSPTDL